MTINVCESHLTLVEPSTVDGIAHKDAEVCDALGCNCYAAFYGETEPWVKNGDHVYLEAHAYLEKL